MLPFVFDNNQNKQKSKNLLDLLVKKLQIICAIQ